MVVEHFQSFGINVADSVNVEQDDGHSPRIQIPYNITFFGQEYDHFYVRVSFGR